MHDDRLKSHSYGPTVVGYREVLAAKGTERAGIGEEANALLEKLDSIGTGVKVRSIDGLEGESFGLLLLSRISVARLPMVV